MEQFRQDNYKTEQEGNNKEKPSIKEGVDFVFEQNPELEKIGTKEKYSDYIENIFPESEFKEIVLHGTKHEFETFSGSDYSFFTKDLSLASHVANFSSNGLGKARIIPAVLDAKKIWHYEKEGNGQEMANFHFDQFINQGYDTFINSKEIVATNPTQIHILGNKEDLEKFKEFVEGGKNVSIEHKFAHIYLIMQDGKEIGEIEIPTDLDGDTYSISDIHLKDEYRGKGLGVATYKALIKKLDKPIETFMATSEATNVWESLVRQGLAEKTEYGYRSIHRHDDSNA